MSDPRDKKFRQLAAIHQHGCCHYCGCPMWSDDPALFAQQHRLSMREVAWFQCTAEHLIARRDGGTSSRNNIAAACRYCNLHRHQRKASPSAEQYRAMVRNRIARSRWYPYHVHERFQLALSAN